MVETATPAETVAPELAAAPVATRRWLVVREAADRARVGSKSIYRAVASRQLRAARVGNRRDLRFRPEWVDAWLDRTAEPVEVCR